MCIASFYKFDDKSVFTFTRDERANRQFKSPEWIRPCVFAPLDLEAGGTWIGINEHWILSLQNGGTTKHHRDLPYDLSRGKLLLELLETNDWTHFKDELRKFKIEPFTLTAINWKTGELEVHVYENKSLNSSRIAVINSFINCSATLYDVELKQSLRGEFLSSAPINEDELFDFHLQHTIGSSKNPLKIPSSTSITQFVIRNKIHCRFLDLNSENKTCELTVLNVE